MTQVTPTTLSIPSVASGASEIRFDLCLFYKHGSSVETSLPCKPPAYTTELRLHIEGTDVFLPIGDIKIIQPQLTHAIIK